MKSNLRDLSDLVDILYVWAIDNPESVKVNERSPKLQIPGIVPVDYESG